MRNCLSYACSFVMILVIGGCFVLTLYKTENPWERVGLVVGVLGILSLAMWGWWERRKNAREMVALLSPRQPMDATTFGKTFFSELTGGPELAAVVRQHLEQHMAVDLSGLRPEDPLQAIHADLDPVFFEDLGAALGVTFPTQDMTDFLSEVESLTTVRDLMEYVNRKSKE